MSLHAQLSPESAQRLAARDRSTSISSFVIALMATALIGVILFIIAIGFPEKEFPEMAFVKGTSIDEPSTTTFPRS